MHFEQLFCSSFSTTIEIHRPSKQLNSTRIFLLESNYIGVRCFVRGADDEQNNCSKCIPGLVFSIFVVIKIKCYVVKSIEGKRVLFTGIYA